MEGKEFVGKITHYYNKIGVAVVELSAKIRVGERIIVEGPGVSFEQTVESMQAEHVDIREANPGESIGLKVSSPVKEGYKIYRAQ
ncbi:MAG: U32 family peptidase C-terminal domain-containing protein [Candidatus Micrarchaeaceae archaeon]